MGRAGVTQLLLCTCCFISWVANQEFVNVAMKKTYRQISDYSYKGNASNAADGNTSGSHDDNTCSHTDVTHKKVPDPPNEYHWWQVDLGRTFPVHDITVWARTHFRGRLYPFNITVDNQTCVSVTSDPGTRSHSVRCTSVMYGQVVRLTLMNKPKTLNLCELQIFVPKGVSRCPAGRYGPDCQQNCGLNCGRGPGANFCDEYTGSCYEENVAIEKTYSQSSKHTTSWPSSNAANGNTGGVYDGNNCIHTFPNQSGHHWWQVDLGRTFPVRDITVWARYSLTGVYNDRLYPFTITVNNETCVNVTSPPSTGRSNSVTCSSVLYGRMVRLTVTKSKTMLNLCEFQLLVPGEVSQCEAGRYGTDCQPECGENCGGGSGKNFCYQDTGVCYDGCNGNFAGDFCTECKGNFAGNDCKGCKEGFWGNLSCENPCPANCSAGVCQRENGYCDGCQLGYHGDQCTSRCSSLSSRCTQCSQDGTCTACTGQFMAPNCTDCAQGYYKLGEGCQECSSDCRDVQCDPDTGSCYACPDGRYGELCNDSCSPGCARCDQHSGNCTACDSNSNLVLPGCTDCAEGYFRQGDGCQRCSSDCRDRTCDRDTGKCDVLEVEEPTHTSAAVGATVGILAFLVLAVILVIIVIRRRKSAPKSDCARGEAAETRSSSSWTESINNVHSSTLTCSALRPNPADQPSGASGDQVYAVVSKSKTRQSVSTRDVIYENVTTPDVKQKKKKKKKKKTNAAINSEVKPPLAPKTSKGRQSSVGTTTSGNPLSDDEDEYLNVTDAIYANEEKPTGMRVDQLMQTVVKKLREGSLDGEFVRLPPNKDFTRKNGERKENYYKNRYNSILPYDKNRVELEQVDGDDASDYVNASFVTGYTMEKAYIAAQGPRDNTVDDLWRMVWQEGVTDIVMLTNVKEGKKSKCYEYWPAQGDKLTTGHMEVTGVEEEIRAHFVIRTFDLKQAEGSGKRRVKQYHYQSWMDHEVPATTPLVNFWRYVRSCAPRTAQAPPLVVHCSAGVGRSGTFIALDIVIDHAQQEAEVNIYNTVARLRDDRCLMVQNKNQYVFLHEAVVEAYMSGDSRIQMSDMDTVLPHTVTHHTPSDRIDQEFEALCKTRDCLTTPTYTAANMKENRAKNRNPNALPNDKHLVYLTKHVKGRNQYINAVYMTTFLQQQGSIMTQLPLPDTLVDLWRLVDGCDVNTIVSIGDVDGKKNMCCYWPKEAERQIHAGPYTISFQSAAKVGNALFSYKLNMETDTKSREVRVLHYAGWTGQVADNMADLLHLLTSLHTSHHDRGGKPVIVQCIDGASQSGVVCALWDVISRMTCDAELDVYMAVRQLHTVRPEALTSVEQYRLCYAVAQTFKNSQNVYANE